MIIEKSAEEKKLAKNAIEKNTITDSQLKQAADRLEPDPAVGAADEGDFEEMLIEAALNAESVLGSIGDDRDPIRMIMRLWASSAQYGADTLHTISEQVAGRTLGENEEFS
eukprot:5084904-Pyramimonas_sp.AAC.1